MIGCTGFIGRELLPRLLSKGHKLTIISRQKTLKLAKYLPIEHVNFLQIDPSNISSWEDKSLVNILNQVDAIVNLAGEPIAEKRWTIKHREKIANSRLITTKSLVNALNKCIQMAL